MSQDGGTVQAVGGSSPFAGEGLTPPSAHLQNPSPLGEGAGEGGGR